jgi:hypothetical protein
MRVRRLVETEDAPDGRRRHAMNALPEYFQFWIVLITIPNLIVIALMVLVFALLVVLPIPRRLEAPAAGVGSPGSRGSEQEHDA